MEIDLANSDCLSPRFRAENSPPYTRFGSGPGSGGVIEDAGFYHETSGVVRVPIDAMTSGDHPIVVDDRAAA